MSLGWDEIGKKDSSVQALITSTSPQSVSGTISDINSCGPISDKIYLKKTLEKLNRGLINTSVNILDVCLITCSFIIGELSTKEGDIIE